VHLVIRACWPQAKAAVLTQGRALHLRLAGSSGAKVPYNRISPMTAVAPPPPSPSAPAPPPDFDPDSFRMTIGEHLEELRTRLIFALIGLAVAAAACFSFGRQVTTLFCRPLISEMQKQNLNPQLFYNELSDGFTVYMKISLICAAVLAAPWMVYQIWQFVAAGLYPHERKYVTKYVPLSIGLLIAGMLFVYFVVLPWTISFFLIFGNAFQLPQATLGRNALVNPPAALPVFPMLAGDPMHPVPGNAWFNTIEGRLKFFLNNNDVRVLQFGPSNLLAPHITLPDYIDLVVNTLLTFGLCFQLPLVVLTVVRIGVVDVATFKKSRRYVYFGISVLAATMTPGDMITAMMALMLPLILLFELGIFLAGWGNPPAGLME
jgi:sec-independent protein translocase protein TatC